MRFIVPISEFDFYSNLDEDTHENFPVLDASTSVNYLKAHYFESLAKIGEIIKVSPSQDSELLKQLCTQDDVIFATFHENPPDDLACRLLQHTKGALMTTGGFLNRWTFREATLNIVTSQKQSKQLYNGLGEVAPTLGVLVPKLNTDIFCLPTDIERESAKKWFKVKKECFHIVYAGRFIANKGIAQLIRALNISGEQNIRVTLVGDFEPDFFIYQSNANHTTFSQFFDREILESNKFCDLICLKSMDHHTLRSLFWSADCFVYPSFHEDENFGITPREAILCGLPTVVSDFCGLGQLASIKGGVVKTYPTLGGVRYSLKQLSEEIIKIKSWTKKQQIENKHFNAEWITNECNPDKSIELLKAEAFKFLRILPEEAPIGNWRSKERFDKWMEQAPNSFQEAVKLNSKLYPEGLYVDGTGDIGVGWFSEPHFFTAIQGLYTTYSSPQEIVKGNGYRGFWRIKLWEEEKAIVEFGFPGPRIKRYNETNWMYLRKSVNTMDDPIFYPNNQKNIELVQELVQLGYLVPDDL
ncbi:glycosyltransferase [Flavobacterium ovatum]|uniref:glycosyltransferase n=1 Tax=Flavobacterium ovatum TaxID=1928857 RepID=UPI00344B3C73